MSNLKEIRTRLGTVVSTKQITGAMKLISAVKLRKAQDAIIQLRPYAEKLHEIIYHCNACFIISRNKLLAPRPIQRVLIILISSNRGLCGAFNINIAKAAIQVATVKFNHLYSEGKVDFICIGRKGFEYLRSKGFNVLETKNELLDNLTFENASSFIEVIIEKYRTGQYDQADLVYNSFKNAMVQKITVETFLPLKAATENSNGSKPEVISQTISDEYIIEPSTEILAEQLIPKMLRTEFYKAFIDSYASEHGARMTAMYKATDNATKLISELRLKYNKARQSSITNEIIEIVGGAESLGR